MALNIYSIRQGTIDKTIKNKGYNKCFILKTYYL